MSKVRPRGEWNSTAPVSYYYNDDEFTGYNGNYWLRYGEVNLY